MAPRPLGVFGGRACERLLERWRFSRPAGRWLNKYALWPLWCLTTSLKVANSLPRQESIQRVLGTDRNWNVILVGVGNLGRALSGYRGFQQQGFQLVGAFDSDPAKIGSSVGSLTIQSLDQLPEFARSNQVDLAILAVPADAAQSVASQIERVGIPGILNFAPIAVQASSSSRTIIQEVDLAIELQRLAFSVVPKSN